LVDDALRTLHLDHVRSRGPGPLLTDSEVITIEIVGAFLGIASDVALFTHFRRYHSTAFPHLQHINRTTFIRQAANLWNVKRRPPSLPREVVVPADDQWIVG